MKHKLTAEAAEGEWTGSCPCGWQESGSTRQVVRDEFQYHLLDLKLTQVLEERSKETS